MIYFIDNAILPADFQKISQEQWIQLIGISAVLVLVIDFIANMLSSLDFLVGDCPFFSGDAAPAFGLLSALSFFSP